MSALITSDFCSLIVGGGATGLSIARFLENQGQRYRVYDTRDDITVLNAFRDINATADRYCGDLSDDLFKGISQLIVSPGVPIDSEVIKAARGLGLPVKGDIALFLEHVNVPVIGITGSNGKSTVTTMVGLSAAEAGVRVAVGGNLGTPALDLIADGIELYVLELSSFQLESTDNAALDVAAILNISPDHMDRHKTMMVYFQAKQKIFHQARSVIYNMAAPLTQPPIVDGVSRYGFSLAASTEKNETRFYLNHTGDELIREAQFSGEEVVMQRSEVKQKGLHNLENVLAVLAIAEAANIDASAVIAVAKTFVGLPHRCEFIDELDGVSYVNDSKATNVGATVAAIKGFAPEVNKIILLAGGISKGADFIDLAKVVKAHYVVPVLYGEDAQKIASVLDSDLDLSFAESLEEAVIIAHSKAFAGDMVLLSPACASFDAFANFEHRGDVFRSSVEALKS